VQPVDSDDIEKELGITFMGASPGCTVAADWLAAELFCTFPVSLAAVFQIFPGTNSFDCKVNADTVVAAVALGKMLAINGMPLVSQCTPWKCLKQR
jgi:hypothetical protein